MLLGVDILTLQGLARRLGPNDRVEPVHSEVHKLVVGTHPIPPVILEVDNPTELLMGMYRDLADAGFESHHVEAAGELLGDTAWWTYGKTLLDGYVRWRTAVHDHNLLRHSDVVQSASDHVAQRSQFPWTQLYWYGIYDLTGIMAEFVSACCRRIPGTIYFPEFEREGALPPIPRTPDDYLREVYDSIIQPIISDSESLPGPSTKPNQSTFSASGVEAELEEVARRISAWAAEQESPQWSDVGIIVRECSAYDALARRVFRRYAIPVHFSAAANGRNEGHVRQMMALLQLMEGGIEPRAFFDVLRMHGGVKDALSTELGALESNIQFYGVASSDDWDRLSALWAEGVPKNAPRPVSADACREFLARLQATRTARSDWLLNLPLNEHLDRWESLVHLFAEDRLNDRLTTIRSQLATTPVPVERAAFLSSLTRILAAPIEHNAPNAGVQFLDVMSARGMVFEHLYLMGINRHQWPRNVHDDALFPDSVRRKLRQDLGLHGLPVKERGHAEEALLFRHAIQAGRNSLVVSYQRADANAKPLNPSPFLDWVQEDCEPMTAVPRRRMDVLTPLIAAKSVATLPPIDVGYVVAVEHGEQAGAIAQTLCESSPRLDRLLAGLAAGTKRNAIIADVNDYDGLIGERAQSAQSVWQPWHPTVLQRLLECPWRGFVERNLRVQPVPIPPKVPIQDRRMIGKMVHNIHERAASWLRAQTDRDAPIDWPTADDKALVWAKDAIEHELKTYAGDPIIFRVLLQPIVQSMTDALMAALHRDFGPTSDRRPDYVEHKLTGSVTLDDGRTVPMAARVDRLDRTEEFGKPDWFAVDLKVGAPPKRGSRRIHSESDIFSMIGKGRLLQAAFYHWLSTDRPLHSAEYTYLQDAPNNLSVSAEGWAQQESMARTVLTIGVDLVSQGAFVLRRNHHCQWCDVSATCLRHHRPATKRLEMVSEIPEDNASLARRVVDRFQRMVAVGVERMDAEDRT